MPPVEPPWPIASLSEREFELFAGLLQRTTGVLLPAARKEVVAARLLARLSARGRASFASYYELIQEAGEAEERQIAIDRLTTHETAFFREPAHFDYLEERVLRRWPRGRRLRLWSAACSTGEEAYSLALVAAHCFGPGDWRVLGTDVSEPAIETARAGLYPLGRSADIPARYLKAHCLRGVGRRAGSLSFEALVRERVEFQRANLCEGATMGAFDVVLLRNVLIYFDGETKRRVITAVGRQVRPGGTLLLGHAEGSIPRVDGLRCERPSIYVRAGDAK